MKYGPCLSFYSLPSHPEQVHAFTIQVLPDRRMEAVILCASSRRSGRVPFSMTSDRIRRLHSVPVAIRVKTENQPSFKQIRGAFQMYRFDQWKTKHENNCALHPYEKKREQWKKFLKCPHKVTDTCTLQFLYTQHSEGRANGALGVTERSLHGRTSNPISLGISDRRSRP